MALKRKRSTPSFASNSPHSTSSYNSTSTNGDGQLPFVYAQSKPVETLYQKPTWSFPTYGSDDVTSSHHLGSRTRKRHRDDRPDESSIHVNTIFRLFDAQRQHPHAEPLLSSQPVQPQIAQTQTQRSTLHAFWNINSRPSAPDAGSAMMLDPGPASNTSTNWDMRCEDCDTPLQGQDAMGLDEGIFAQLTECCGCRRRVCDCCAILGDQRVCLGCATGQR